MKSKPILFSTPMVQAVLEGRKTQTRRIIKPQPIVEVNGWSWEGTKKKAKFASGVISVAGLNSLPSDKHSFLPNYNPFGNIGDVLWVRETFRPKGHSFPIGEHFEYKATAQADGNPTDEPWKPSIFMPKDAARIWLKITDVRVERLNDISEEDAIAEGIEVSYDIEVPNEPLYYFYPHNDLRDDSFVKTASTSFFSLWNSINGLRSWKANPWVWVIEFERIEKPSEV